MKEHSQMPTGTHVGNSSTFPGVEQGHMPLSSQDDAGMKGAKNDRMGLMNAHPHQEHSIGYKGAVYENHGFEAFHIMHGKREKMDEHHPANGMK